MAYSNEFNPFHPSVCMFFVLFSLHFLTSLQGDFVQKSRASLFGNYFLYSRDLNVLPRDYIVGRNEKLVAPGAQKGHRKWLRRVICLKNCAAWYEQLIEYSFYWCVYLLDNIQPAGKKNCFNLEIMIFICIFAHLILNK